MALAAYLVVIQATIVRISVGFDCLTRINDPSLLGLPSSVLQLFHGVVYWWRLSFTPCKFYLLLYDYY